MILMENHIFLWHYSKLLTIWLPIQVMIIIDTYLQSQGEYCNEVSLSFINNSIMMLHLVL